MPGGALGRAAITLGRQGNISIGIRDPKLVNLRVHPVRGTLSVEQALGRLLAGSGARYVLVAPRTFLIVTASPKTLSAAPKIRRRQAPAPPPTPRAEPPQPADVEPQAEIVVTGSRRALALSSYPGAATVLEADDVVFQGLRGSEALLERVAGVTSTHLGPGRNKLFLRGIADSSFNGPTQSTVGQYLGETRLNYNAPDPDLRLHDIERIEVLPGPQGTLYGAGSLGGVIRTLPKAPDLFSVGGAVAAGMANTRFGAPSADAAGLLNVPIAKGSVALRLSAYAQSEGGYIDDLQRELDDVNRTRISGGRAALRAATGNGWTIDLGFTAQKIIGEDAQFADRDGPPLTRRSNVPQDYRNSYALADLVVSRRWGDIHLVSATGLVRQTLAERYDSTKPGGLATLFEQRSRITMLSSDTRLSRQGRDGVGWLIGASLVSNASRQERALGAPGSLQPITGVGNSIEEATLYGEASVSPAEKIVVTAGGRFTHARISGAALDVPAAVAADLRGLQASRRSTSFIPSFSVTAAPAEGLSLFLRYQEGFRPGGLAVAGDIVQRFRGDRIASTEAGLRYRKPGAKGFEAAASLAYTRWSDIQADVIDFSGMPTTANIGNGRIYTLDLRASWRPVSGLSFDFGAVLNHSRVTNPAPTIIISPTAELPNVAKINLRAGAEYQTELWPGYRLRLAAAARYVGESRLGIGPVLGEPQGDWLDTRISAEVRKGPHTVSLTVSNLADEQGNRFAFGSPFTLVDRRQVTPLRPRSIRLGWGVRF